MRRSDSPTAIGRTSPLGLRSAVRGAPAIHSDSSGGAVPRISSVATAASALRKPPSSCAWVVWASSRKWAGDRPDAPPADARGKRLMAFRISAVSTGAIGGIGSSSNSSVVENSCGPSDVGVIWGCFSCNLCSTSVVGLCMPRECKACVALPRAPSLASSRARRRFAFVMAVGEEEVCGFRLEAVACA